MNLKKIGLSIDSVARSAGVLGLVGLIAWLRRIMGKEHHNFKKNWL